jgi:hypothetical protein
VGIATQPGQQRSEASVDGAGGEVNNQLDRTSIASGAPINPDLSLEVRVHEYTDESVNTVQGENKLVNAAPGLRFRILVLVTVMTIAGIYVGVHIGKGWVPADDGALSQSALRVLQGQLPHRDFGEIYTGGLSFIHALAFRAFGVNLMSLRICVFLFFLAWLPAVYYIALRFTSPVAAGAITLLAVAWSYPNYPAAMPSWYNLFFATFGAAALLFYLEVRTRRWLFVAGVCGGLSILVKVIGAYYIAGGLLFLAFLEQSESATQSSEGDSRNGSWTYRMFSIGSLLLFMTMLLMVLRARLGPAELYQLVLPSAAIVMLILAGERGVRAGTGDRFRAIFRVVIPFIGGLVSPIIIFLIPYARSGTAWTLLSGVTSSAISRASGLGVIRPLGIEKLVYVLPLVGILAAAMYWEKFQGKVVAAALGLGALVIVVRSAQSFDVLYGVWCSVAVLTPIVVLLGAVMVLLARSPSERTKLKRQQVTLLIALAATCSLVQFPFAAAIYLSYTIPLTLLAMVAIVSTGKTKRGTYALASVVGLYLAFGVVSLVPHYIYEITWVIGDMQAMHEPRAGGLKIEEAVFFDDLARFLREHSPNGLMFAGNDCPELYFLSGLKNVANDDTGEPPQEMLKTVQSANLKLVVLNDAPYFPGAALQPEVRAEVMKKFPYSARFGIFEVFWKQ